MEQDVLTDDILVCVSFFVEKCFRSEGENRLYFARVFVIVHLLYDEMIKDELLLPCLDYFLCSTSVTDLAYPWHSKLPSAEFFVISLNTRQVFFWPYR